jgi:endonuclease-8
MRWVCFTLPSEAQTGAKEKGKPIITDAGFRRTTGRSHPNARLWVYGRTSKPCRNCGTLIACRKQGFKARLTFWCPHCQSS